MTSPSIHLVEYLVSMAKTDLREDLAHSASLALLDTIGCGLYGASQRWGRIVSEMVLSERSHGNATLYGSQETVAPIHAALANGTATHGIELDDVILGALVHPGAVVIPAALAAAEQYGASGPRLIAAVVAGYEMTDRLSLALGAEHNNRGFHTTGVAGPIAATVAAGIVMGFDASRLHTAIGIACSSASGIKAFTQGTGGMVKRMHAGRAAEAGVLACELAQRGFTGPIQAIDGRFGLLDVIGGSDRNSQHLDRDLGTSCAITRVWVKAYPCCGLLHSTSHALEALKDEHQLKPEQITQVRVHTGRRAVEQNGDPAPRETMAAQYSIPYCVGVSLAKDGRDPAAYAEENLWDPQVRAVAARTVLSVDAHIDQLFPAHFGTRVEIDLNDGRTLQKTVIDAHGTPPDPCTAAEIENKFRMLAGAVKTPDALERIIEAVHNLHEAASIEKLSHVLRTGNLAAGNDGKTRLDSLSDRTGDTRAEAPL